MRRRDERTRSTGAIRSVAAIVALSALPGCFSMPKGYSSTDLAAQSSANLQSQFDIDKDRLTRQMRAAESELDLRFAKMKLSIDALTTPAEDPRRVAIEGSFMTESNRWQEIQKQASEILSWSEGIHKPITADTDKLSVAVKNHDKDHKSIRMNLSNLRSNVISLAVKRER